MLNNLWPQYTLLLRYLMKENFFFSSVARKKAKRNEYIKFAFCKNGDHLCYTKVPLDLYFCKNGDQIIQKLPPKSNLGTFGTFKIVPLDLYFYKNGNQMIQNMPPKK